MDRSLGRTFADASGKFNRSGADFLKNGIRILERDRGIDCPRYAGRRAEAAASVFT